MKIVISIALALFFLGCSEDKAATSVENNNSVVVEQSAPAVETPAVETPVIEEATNAAAEVVEDATNTVVETTDAVTDTAAEATTNN
ncbi:MAG TPA: hypothetical protein CFH84_03070 [Sulfurimonas sp. UBA12504]|nr:MAG: hypothetical protein A2019_01950 [Sulfurimonas sp. GWF2_37_8]DAB30616.1 MAG TPA: hypothetical protein CFH84_03070 [Sulfurimonas sp. UBA12504]